MSSVKFKDGSSFDAKRFCGSRSENQKRNIFSAGNISAGNFFQVTFHSNEIYDATGFEAFYHFKKLEGMLTLAEMQKVCLHVEEIG